MGLLKVAGKVLKAGANLLGEKPKTEEEIKSEIALLDPRAQYNRTMARPRVAIIITSTFVIGQVTQWIQVILKTPKEYVIDISAVQEMTLIIVTAYFVSRGFEKITSIAKGVGTIFKKKNKVKKNEKNKIRKS